MRKKLHFDNAIVIVVLFGFVFLFGLMSYSLNGSSFISEITGDSVLDDDEAAALGSLTCDELKSLLNTEKEVCLYLKDDNGDIQTLSGCEGVILEGKKVCLE